MQGRAGVTVDKYEYSASPVAPTEIVKEAVITRSMGPGGK
jgi:hypothetical protein